MALCHPGPVRKHWFPRNYWRLLVEGFPYDPELKGRLARRMVVVPFENTLHQARSVTRISRWWRRMSKKPLSERLQAEWELGREVRKPYLGPTGMAIPWIYVRDSFCWDGRGGRDAFYDLKEEPTFISFNPPNRPGPTREWNIFRYRQGLGGLCFPSEGCSSPSPKRTYYREPLRPNLPDEVFEGVKEMFT